MGPGRQLQGKHFQAGGFYKNIPEGEEINRIYFWPFIVLLSFPVSYRVTFFFFL